MIMLSLELDKNSDVNVNHTVNYPTMINDFLFRKHQMKKNKEARITKQSSTNNVFLKKQSNET